MAYKPEYTISNSILNYVAEAEAARQIIENSLLVPHWERKFQTEALVRTIHHSVAIEGNGMSLSETEKVIRGEDVKTIRMRDIQEILNYRDVIDYLAKADSKVLSIKFLLDLHKQLGKRVLPPEQCGVLRQKDSAIVSSKTGEVVFDPPPASEVKSEIEELCDWDAQSGNVNALLKAGILHYELVRIHPFVDLNGRTSRIVATWSMFRDGYDIRKFFSLEEHYDQDTKRYYEALDSANNGDLTPWLEYFTEGVAIELRRVKEQVLGLSRDRKLIEKMGQVALNERQIGVIQYLEENESIRNQEFRKLFPEISDDTILRDLKDLMEKKILAKKGRTKAAFYQLK
jgi:Fic family protein